MRGVVISKTRDCRKLLITWRSASWWSSIFSNTESLADAENVKVHGQHSRGDCSLLEGGGSPLQQHLQREQKYCERHFDAVCALQQQLRREMLDQCPDQVESLPESLGVHQYLTCATPARPMPCYLRRQPAGGEDVLLDMNDVGSQGSLGQMKVSKSQRLLSYTLETEQGSETYTVYVDDLDAGETIDVISDVHSIELGGDDKSLLYTISDASRRPSKVMLHKIGESTEQDVCLLEEPDEQFYLHVGRTKDYRFFTLNANSKTSSEVHILDANNPWEQGKMCIEPRSNGCEYFVEHHRGQLYILTNEAGGEYVVKSAEVMAEKRLWKTVVPVRQGRCIEDMDIFDSALVLYERLNGWPAISVLSLQEGKGFVPQLREINLPEHLTELIPSANPDFHAEGVVFRMSSPITPEATWQLNLTEPLRVSQVSTSGTMEQSKQTQINPQEGSTPGSVNPEPADFICTRVEAESADGTMIPITLSHKGGLRPDGSHNTLLHAYGAYGMCLDAGFQPERLSLLKRGWVVALAHVRGGGELGRRWHKSATGPTKHKSVDDLEACMDFLISRGYSSKGRIALEASSAGGLLAAALINRRPDCIGAAVLRVPFVDVLTTMLNPSLPLTMHEYDEFGNPSANEAALHSLQALCPYANIRPQVFPPILVTCALNDQRVPARGPAKYVARVRGNQLGRAKILLAHTDGGGHFGDEADAVDEAARNCAFLLHALDGGWR